MPNLLKNRPVLVFGLCLAGILVVLFARSFDPSMVVFSNDGPLGAQHAAAAAEPSGILGIWNDLNTLGNSGGSAFLSVTTALSWLLGPLGFAKFFVPVVLAFLGLCAWFCFRQLKLSPLACLLGALAAVLSSTYFCLACWGVGPQDITVGMSYVAIGLLCAAKSWRQWPKLVLAGMAVGMGVMEGFDIGVIYSLAVATFVMYQALASEGPFLKRAMSGIGRVTVVAACALFVAAQAVIGLFQTQIQGVVGTEQDKESKAEHWDFATQWSLPKTEAISLLVPGVFGYRMDTREGGNYWGRIGRDPAWYAYFNSGQKGPRPAGFLRHGGGGSYVGVLVALAGLWAALQTLRKQGSVFSPDQRKLMWFMMGGMVVALLLAFGRHAPFYQFFYALPYSSTIRNPAKFLHLFNFGMTILFAYGVHGLSKRYMETSTPGAAGQAARGQNWWAKATAFDRRWVMGTIIGVGVALVAWLIYSSSRDKLVNYLTELNTLEGQSPEGAAGMAQAVAAFSIGQVGWFIAFLILAVVLLAAIVTGRLSGSRARLGGVLLGLFLVIDLSRADWPWIRYWDYKQKYATNGVIDFLREKPYEHRLTALPMWTMRAFGVPERYAGAEQYLEQLYRIEWMQHHFQYYDVQCIDIVQMPRMPADLNAFETMLQPSTQDTIYVVPRRWQLTNTRYLLAAAAFGDILNKGLDQGQERFRPALRFDIGPKPNVANPTGLEDLTATISTNGAFALWEFTGALPRAKLYSNWQTAINDQAAVSELRTNVPGTNEMALIKHSNEMKLLKQIGTNDFLTLKKLGSRSFDPDQTVLMASPAGNQGSALADNASGTTNSNKNAGTVEFVSYAPKRINLLAKADVPSVLLLNDRFDPNWKVTVDGKPETVLRCNYIMRGVRVPAGEHRVEFRFEPPLRGLFISLAAIVGGLGLIGFLNYSKPPQPTVPPPAPAEPKRTAAVASRR